VSPLFAVLFSCSQLGCWDDYGCCNLQQGSPNPHAVLRVVLTSLFRVVHCTVLYCRAYRPYGVSTLLATYGKEGPQLYLVEPSGTTHVRTGVWQGLR